MRLVLLIAIIIPFINSCDESFNPHTAFKQNYGVACILRSDTTLQVTTLFKSYFDEKSNQPKLIFEDNADVRIWRGDSVYRLKDTTFISNSSNDSIKCYFTNKFKIDSNEDIEIEVLLSSGKRLKGLSKTPPDISFKNTSEVIIPPVNKNVIQIFWNSAGIENFYTAQMKIKCEMIENGTNKIFYRILPKSIVTVDGVTIPVYPKPTKNASVVYNLDAISWYLQEFADSLSNTNAVTIHQSIEVEIITFDREVSRYISVSNSSTDNLSIRFDEGEYTNITGGLGVLVLRLVQSIQDLNF
jgi:hypothetical protein